MEDFRNSLAQQDVSISTETVVSSVVGDNFYKVLYLTSANIAPTYMVKATYEDAIASLTTMTSVQQALMKDALSALFANAADVEVYAIKPADYAMTKYKGYFVYVEPSYTVNEETGVVGVADDMKLMLQSITLDKEFNALFTDLAIPVALATTGTAETLAPVKQLATELNTLQEITVFARGADAGYSFIDQGVSPAMYQLGRTLGTLNSTGTPIGNSFDMTACNRENVLPTLDMSTDTCIGVDATVAKFFEDNNICYFKAVGNGTGQVLNYGASSLRGELCGVAWVRAYCNYMVRVNCATLLSRMNTFKDSWLYGQCISIMSNIVTRFVGIGRLELYSVTAPDWATAKGLSDGHSIVIPHAWEAYYVDDVRKLKISGTLYVSA